MCFVDDCTYFISYAQIESEVGTDAEVVLYVPSEHRHSFRAKDIGTREVRLKLRRDSLQEVLDGREGPDPIRLRGLKYIVENTLKIEASADAMPAFRPGKIVINLRRRVTVEVLTARGQTAGNANGI